MKPTPESYHILSMKGNYYVLSPYELYAMPCLSIIGPAFDTKKEADTHRKLVYESNLSSYERLKAMGRDFPDND